MENKKIEFTREKLATMQKISKELLTDLQFGMNTEFEDVINNQMTLQLSAFIYSNMAEERDMEFYFPKPTFLDWLLKRSRKVTLHLKVKDLKINAPRIDNTLRVYEIKQRRD